MRFIALFLSLGIVGCASTQTPDSVATGPVYNIQFTAQANYPEKNIRWVTVEDISSFCQAKVPLKSNKRLLACSEYNNKSCTIYTGRTTDMAVVGHEIRHCFEGQWHQ